MAGNPTSLDPVSKHVPEREKLLRSGRPVLAALYERRKWLSKLKYPSSPQNARGQVLLTAMLFGALLDWQALDRLCAVLSEGSGVPDDGWLEFQTAESPDRPAVTRRWCVDDHTRKLWGLTSGLLSSLRSQHPAAHARAALAAYLQTDVAEVEQLHTQACYWWRQRLPPVLATHVEGYGLSRAVPRENWQRLITGGKGPVAPPKSRQSNRSATSDPTRLPMPAALERDLWLIRKQLTAAMLPAVAKSRRAATALGQLQPLALQTLPAQHVRDWFCECLQNGYDHDPGRRKKRGHIISPSTLKGDLSRLCRRVLPGLLRAGLQTKDLLQLYAEDLPDDLRQDYLENRFRTFRRFHRWLVANQGYPPLTFRFVSTGPRRAVRARLISEVEYHRALALAKAASPGKNCAALAVALILGFRAGLRPQELLALQPGDFRLGADGFVLLIKPNRHSRLKTANARRILPLHLLLSSEEQAEVAKLVRSRQNLRGSTKTGVMLLHDARTPNDVIRKGLKFEKQVEHLLVSATGDPEAQLYELRHSFATYVLATLLLPDEWDARLASTVGPDCISKARRDRLMPHLLGLNVKGRSALYAVSFLMGHASPDWTLVYYLHLLDWSAAQYVARSANDGLTMPAVNPPTGIARSAIAPAPIERQPDCRQELQPDWPEWPFVVQALSDLIDGANQSLIAARSGIEHKLLTAWLARLRLIVDYKTRRGLQRHRFVASTRLASSNARHGSDGKRPRFVLPRDDSGKQAIANVWAACRAGQGGPLGHHDVEWALRLFLVHADPARCDVPLPSISAAVRYVTALIRLGLSADNFRVRLQPKGTADRTPLLVLPERVNELAAWQALVAKTSIRGRPISEVSRLRISIVSDQPETAHAMPSHRIALMLAVVAGQFPLP